MITPERHYVGELGKRYHEQKRSVPDVAVPWVARLRAEKLQPEVKTSDTVFEYGAGYGWNLLALHCARKVAFDISDAPRESTGSIEWVSDSQALPRHFAQVVICHHVLEHVANPVDVLKQIGELLSHDGQLLLFVPFEKERRYRHFDPTEPNHHLYSWNVQTLGNLVAECGFQIDSARIGKFGYDRFAAKLALKFSIGESGFRMLRTLAHLLKPASEVRITATPG